MSEQEPKVLRVRIENDGGWKTKVTDVETGKPIKCRSIRIEQKAGEFPVVTLELNDMGHHVSILADVTATDDQFRIFKFVEIS